MGSWRRRGARRARTRWSAGRWPRKKTVAVVGVGFVSDAYRMMVIFSIPWLADLFGGKV